MGVTHSRLHTLERDATQTQLFNFGELQYAHSGHRSKFTQTPFMQDLTET